MRDGGKLAAAIDVLSDVMSRHQPVKSAAKDWGKRARYAGAKDRAWVSGLVLDALRRRQSLAHAMGDESPRALCIGALAHVWKWDIGRIDSAFDEEHAPSPLTLDERERIVMAPDPTAPVHVHGDFPEWMTPSMTRAFGENIVVEAQAMAVRAPVDLRVNTLKSDAEKAEKALRSVKAIAMPLVKQAFRVPAPDPSERAGSVESIPAYSKGWVEVQDAGSQIAAAAANAKPGEQVLDYCAGGGGKSLAMAASMENQGQIYAYDIDGRRLSALIPRLKRAGARNVQLRHPQEDVGLDDLHDGMDLVVIDAPCTGVGTWRRRPDAKWRVSEKALVKRCEEQAEILDKASEFVKPGGRLLYITCSFLMEENEDQVQAFLERNEAFSLDDAAASAISSGLLTTEGEEVVTRCRSNSGTVRLTPMLAGTDGFFMALLRKAS
ncbi:MAG: MFS transporter [Hirschia sp.]|nr:MFS transporter [Hirschia sp.]MBF20114.1 MFS transporter [Hirschia sp.]